MAEILKKVFKIVVDILTFFVFLILVIIIFCKVKMMVSNSDYFDVFGYSIFSVATGSMEPVISQNDIIIIKKQKDYELEDIVTFKKDNAYITHRVTEKRGETFVTKGDANNAKDVAIDKKEIIGKVVKVIPKAGVWQKIFSSPKVIIMIFATLMLFDFAFSYKGRIKKQNTKLVKKIEDVKLEEVNKREDSPQMTDKEIVELVKKTDMVKAGEDVKFDKKEKDFLNYTIRLDLSELQKQIDDNMKKE